MGTGPVKEIIKEMGLEYPFSKSIRTRMKQIPAIIERAVDGTYSVYCKNEIFSGMGDTIEAAKTNMRQQMEFYKDTAKKEGFKYPEFLDEEFTVVYTTNTTYGYV